MGTSSDRLRMLRNASMHDRARLVYRKAIHRKFVMRRYEASARSCRSIDLGRSPRELEIVELPPGRVHDILELNPYIDEQDVDALVSNGASCVAAFSDREVVATSWFARRRIHLSELGRTLDLGPTDHFVTRSYVAPHHRGHALASVLMIWYAQQIDEGDSIWGLIYPWNVASIRSAERAGRRHTGDYWTHWVLGRPLPGERHFAPRPPSTLS